MAKPEKPSTGDDHRVPPDGKAWRQETDALADRNAETTRLGKQERQAHDKHIAELRRQRNSGGEIFR